MANGGLLINKGFTTVTGLNRRLLLNHISVKFIAKDISAGAYDEIFFGEYSDYFSNILIFPYSINLFPQDEHTQKLRVGDNIIAWQENVPVITPSNLHDYGYFMGQIKFVDISTGSIPTQQYDYIELNRGFLALEPYTNIEVYLPYYGSVSISAKDVYNKWAQFRLKVDYFTGQAMYIIGVSENPITNILYSPSLKGVDDSNTRIIAQYVFQLGTNVPITATHMEQSVRNLIMGVGKTASDIAKSIATVALPEASVVSTTTLSATDVTTKTARNKNTGRQITKGRTTRNAESVERTVTEKVGGTERNMVRASADCLEASANLANSNPPRTITDSPNNVFVNTNSPTKIIITIKTKLVQEANQEFYHLYGRPLGVIGTLSSYSGYTLLNDVHIENTPTGMLNVEKEILYTTLLNGIIL